jgi:hypothetical protein
MGPRHRYIRGENAAQNVAMEKWAIQARSQRYRMQHEAADHIARSLLTETELDLPPVGVSDSS